MSDSTSSLNAILKCLNSQPSSLTLSIISILFAPFANLPFSPDIESLRGYCLQSIRKDELALYIYDDVLARCAFHSPTLRRKAQLLVKLGKQDEAEKLYELSSLLEPDNLYLEVVRNVNAGNEEDETQISMPIIDDDEEDEEEQENQLKKMNSWKIKIKSIDGSVKHITSSKSVLFKKQLEEDQSPKSSQRLKTIPAKKGILKSKSYQPPAPICMIHFSEDFETKSVFNIEKVKSIEGKVNVKKHEEQKEKQVLFVGSSTDADSEVEKQKENGKTAKSIGRKSSLVMGKYSSSKSDVQ